MTDWLLTVAVMYGLTFVIKDAKLFSRPRHWLAGQHTFFYEFLSCPYCVGFHTGWMTFLLLRASDPSLSGWAWFSAFAAYSFAGVTVSGFFDALLIRLEGHERHE